MKKNALIIAVVLSSFLLFGGQAIAGGQMSTIDKSIESSRESGLMNYHNDREAGHSDVRGYFDSNDREALDIGRAIESSKEKGLNRFPTEEGNVGGSSDVRGYYGTESRLEPGVDRAIELSKEGGVRY